MSSDLEAALQTTARSRALGIGMITAVPTLTLIFVVSLGSMSVLVQRDTGMSEAILGYTVSSFFLASALVSTAGARLGGRVGAVGAMRVGIALLAAAMAGTAAVGIHWAAVVPFAVLAGFANGLVQPPANMYLTAQVTYERQGLAFALKQCAYPVAGVLAGMAVPLIGVVHGWRWVYAAGAVLAVLAWIGLGRLAHEPAHVGHTRGGSAAAPPRAVLLKMVAIGAMGSLMGNAMTAFFVASGVSHGLGVAQAAVILSASSAVGIAVRIGLGWCADRFPMQPWLAIMTQFLVWIFGFLGLAYARSPLLILASALLCFGAGWGWPGLFHLAMARRYAGAIAATTGVAMIGVYAGGVIGPSLFSAVLGATSYEDAWTLMAVLSGLAALLAARIAKKERPPA